MKKIILALVAMVAVAGGLVAMSAYEAHIINVTAHIENALAVHPDEVAFGTVFPQEYLEIDFTVNLSESFLAQGDATEVDYVIKQKPKCICDDPTGIGEGCPLGKYAPVDYATHDCPYGYTEMLSLCPFLSKTDADPNDGNDTSHRSYFQENGDNDYCLTSPDPDATGILGGNDLGDLWMVDLKVPPVLGTIGQEWPAGCPFVTEDSQDYGCDLWVEVTNIERD